MKPIYVYPASFCPPTFGHLHIIKKVAKLFPEIILICSKNPDKNQVWFTPKECQALWQSYKLPINISIETLETVRNKVSDLSQIVMIRGIRNEKDAEYEKKIMLYNKKRFGIDKYFYLFGDEEFRHISSSKVRDLANNLEFNKLADYVSPLVISKLLERVLKIKNLFMVVGRPGSGKSTLLKMLVEEGASNIHINTDEFNRELQPLLKQSFGNKNLIEIALTREDDLKKVIAEPWIALLKKSLKQLPKNCNAFIEVPYGLQPNKRIFRFIGGKIIHVWSGDDEINRKRILTRNTPELLPFVEKIPDWEEAQNIVEQNNLNLISIKTSGSIEALREKTKKFNDWLKKEEIKWKTFSPGLYLDI